MDSSQWHWHLANPFYFTLSSTVYTNTTLSFIANNVQQYTSIISCTFNYTAHIHRSVESQTRTQADNLNSAHCRLISKYCLVLVYWMVGFWGTHLWKWNISSIHQKQYWVWIVWIKIKCMYGLRDELISAWIDVWDKEINMRIHLNSYFCCFFFSSFHHFIEWKIKRECLS